MCSFLVVGGKRRIVLYCMCSFYLTSEAQNSWIFRSLRRTFCIPQKCSACQEVIVSQRIRCKTCRRVAHASCHTHHHQSPCASCCNSDAPNTSTQSEPMQETGNCPLVAVAERPPEADTKSSRTSDCSSGSATNHNSSTASYMLPSAIYRRIHDWITQHRSGNASGSGSGSSSSGASGNGNCGSSGISRTKSVGSGGAGGRTSEKHVRGLYGLNCASGKMARKRLKILLGRADRDSCNKNCSAGPSCPGPLSGCADSSVGNGGEDSGIGSPASIYEKSPKTRPMTTTNTLTNTLTSTRVLTAVRVFDRRYSEIADSPQQACHKTGQQTFRQPIATTSRGQFGTRLFASTTVSSSSPFRIRTLNAEGRRPPRDSICATWPPPGKSDYGVVDDALDDSESGFEDDDSIRSGFQTVANVAVKEMGEWQIPFADVQFGQLVRHGRQCDIHRGRWHGDVMIHTFDAINDQEVSNFWTKVASLSMIRHENVSLFMGICVDLPRMAIVTSVRKGCSLYEHLHINNHKFPLPTRVHIARQISQAMSYLHARGIVHQKLNSKNVLLENKVRVCLLDNGMAQSQYDREGYGCLASGHLTYVSPELMRSLHVTPPHINPQAPYTKPSDVFAFGTILYELFGEKLPFHGHRPHTIIWQVGSGHLQSVRHLKCTPSVKNLLSGCWSAEPQMRPVFQDILLELQQNVMMHKRHSSSEPEKLNRLGFATTNLLAY